MSSTSTSTGTGTRKPAPALTAGRITFTLLALNTSISCYIADWNETHVKNPTWPPHARFHNGQTMSLGLLLGLVTLYFTWQPVFAATANKTTTTGGGGGGGGMTEKEAFIFAAVIATLYWVAGLSAILYPGTMWVDPDLGTGAPQAPVFVASAVLPWVALAWEMKRLGAAEKGKSA